MRSLLIALVLAAAPAFAAPAFADGIERPHRPRAARPAPVLAGGPVDIPVAVGPETVSLSDGFLRGSDGGVGAQALASAYVGGGSTVVVRGGRSVAIAIARASASASAVGGFGGGFGGHGCR